MLADPMLAPLLQVLGQATMAPMGMPGQAPGQPPQGPNGAAGPKQPQTGPKMPNMPKNPATNQPWNPEDGGNRQGQMDAGNPTGGAGGGGAA